MLHRCLGAAAALAAIAWAPTADAQTFDYGKYPDLRGQWVRYGPSGPDLKGPLIRLGPSGEFRTRSLVVAPAWIPTMSELTPNC